MEWISLTEFYVLQSKDGAKYLATAQRPQGLLCLLEGGGGGLLVSTGRVPRVLFSPSSTGGWTSPAVHSGADLSSGHDVDQ